MLEKWLGRIVNNYIISIYIVYVKNNYSFSTRASPLAIHWQDICDTYIKCLIKERRLQVYLTAGTGFIPRGNKKEENERVGVWKKWIQEPKNQSYQIDTLQ